MLASITVAQSGLSGRQMRYVSGSFRDFKMGCVGQLDARDPKGLFITCGNSSLTIPNSTIALARLIESPVDEENLQIKIPGAHWNKETSYVYVRTKPAVNTSNWIILEMPARYARDLMVFFIRMREDRDEGGTGR